MKKETINKEVGADSISARKGITLVSLIVTIIILLILAGISISALIGDHGIIKRAQEAGRNYEEAAKYEEEQLAKLYEMIENPDKYNPDEIVGETEKVIKDLQDQIDKLEQEKEEKKNEIKQKDETITDLNQTIEDLRGQINNLNNEKEQLIAKKQELQNELNETKNQLTQANEENSRLQEELAKLNEENANLKEQIANKDTQIANLNKELSDKQTQIGDLQNTITSKDSQIADLQNNIATLTQQKTNLQKEIEEKNAEIANLNNQIATKDTTIKNLQDQLNTLNATLSQTNATANQILTGKKAYSGGKLLTGTMQNRGAVTQTLNAGGSYTIPEGYHNGSGKVTAKDLASQTQATATASDIAQGKTAWVNGKKITGTVVPNANRVNVLCSVENESYKNDSKEVDLKSLLTDYTKYNTNDFLIVPRSIGYYGVSGSGYGSSSYDPRTGTTNISCEYDSATGILKVNGISVGAWVKSQMYYYGYVSSFEVMLVY